MRCGNCFSFLVFSFIKDKIFNVYSEELSEFLRSLDTNKIPEDYIEDAQQRLAMYQRIMKTQTVDACKAIRKELEDRFGPLPDKVDRLIQLVKAQV